MRHGLISNPGRPLLPAIVLAFAAGVAPSSAAAALRSVSGVPDPAVDPEALTEVLAGGRREDVAYSLATGFPLWYRDGNGLKLGLCLDQRVEMAQGGSFFPCLTAEPFPGAPISFPSNFGTEAFWWSASAFGTFTSSVNGTSVLGDALLVLGQEATFATGLAVDGNQAAFGRIRVRISVPVAGTYRVTHPYGQIVYFAAVPGTRAIDQTQDVGNELPPATSGPPPLGDFLAALLDGRDPGTLLPPPGFPAVSGGIVSSVATGIGPFLVPADPFAPVVAADGSTYLSDPGTELVPLKVPVTSGPFGSSFRIELLDPPAGVFLNGADASQVIELEEFQVSGKIFDDSPNVAPVAGDDLAVTAKGKPVVIDVVANDVDVRGAGNAHGIDPRALGIPSTDPADPAGTILLTRPHVTARGATVQRFTEFSTGKTTFVYTPAAGFTGVDAFQYVVQDAGGLVSAPATVTVTVEDLSVARAEWRSRTGRWRVEGTTTHPAAGPVTLLGGPRARLTGAGEVPAVTTGAAGSVTLRVTPDAIEFRLSVDPSPATAVTQAHVHVGAPGEDGPPVFTLYDRFAEPAFPGTKRGTLSDAERIFGSAQTQAGITRFADVVGAILSGNAYVNVHTAAHPGGELRGQLVMPTLGTAAPDPATGEWRFSGKPPIGPGGAPASVNARSANGVWTVGTRLQVK